MIDYIDDKKIDKLSKNDYNIPLYQKIIKLGEEHGELSQAFLSYDGGQNTSRSIVDGDILNVIEETCDVINTAMDILNAITMNDDHLEDLAREIFTSKLIKWENKQQ